MAASYTFHHEIEKNRSNLASMSVANKTAKTNLLKMENELRQAFIKTRATHEDKIFRVISDLITKDDTNDRILGLVSIMAYSKILNENEILSFVNKFIPGVSQKIFLSIDENLIDLGVTVYGVLVGLGGINIAQQIEENVNYCINNLYKPEKRYASLMMLVELLKHAQFITFNKIRKYKYTDLFKSIILEKKPNYKKKGLDLIDECAKEISKRDRHEQTNMLNKIFNDIFKERQTKNLDSEVNYGVVMVIKSLMTYANKEVFEDNFAAICEFIIMLKSSKTISNQLIVLEMFPILSSYNNEAFMNLGFLDKAIEHLLRLLNTQNNHLKRPSHNALAKILEPYHPDKIKDRAKAILEQLYAEFKSNGNKTDSNLLPCMVSVSEKAQKFFTIFFSEEQIHELINLLLINGISEDILSYLDFLLKINLPDINKIIQIKLLHTISYILANNLYPFQISNDTLDKYKASIEDFTNNLAKSLKDANKETNNETLICVSLSCLSRFNFSEFADQMGSFVNDKALVFLDDVRPPVRKAAAKAVTLLSVKQHTSNRFGLSHNMMFQILNKLLYIAISDPDEEVREIMLGSLNKNFDNYLKYKSNLQNLILALNDSNDKVQRKAIIILRRLISSNASDIAPALQNSLYRIIRVINMKSNDTEKDVVQNLKLLKCFINHAPFLLKNQRDLIFKFLLSTLQNQKTTQTVSAEIFSTLSSLVCIAKSATIKYFDQLMVVTLDSFEDMAFTQKRVEAIKCLSNIIRTSGLVVFVNYKYSNLNDLIFLLFQVEANQDARNELMRLMGVLGALDCFNLFKIQSENNFASTCPNNHELVKIIESNHKSKFNFEKIVLDWRIREDPCEVRLKNFFKNIINLNQILNKNAGEDTLTQVIELNELETKRKDQKDVNKILTSETGIRDESIKELLQLKDPINLSDIESLLSYITNVTLKNLLLNLFDLSLTSNHKYIIDDLNTIVYTIGKEISPYLYILVPCLAHYINSCNSDLNHQILQLFEWILKACGSRFGSESPRNVDLLIEIILKNLSDGKCKESCLDTLIELIDSNKSMLKFKMQTICLKLLTLLLSGNESNSVIEKIFKIFKLVKEYNESFLHLILPSFCRILNNSKSYENIMFLKGIINYIKSILSFESTLQYTSNIIHSLIKCIQDREEVSQDCRDCIISLVISFKDHALIYLPLINASFNNNNLRNDPKLKMITDKIKEHGDLEDIEPLDESLTKRNISADGLNANSNTQQNSAKNKQDNSLKLNDSIRLFDSEKVKSLFDISNNVLKEDWEEWLTKASNELLINSPSKVLYCCKTFANVNPNICKDLFNIGFAMIWSQFNDTQKCTVIQNIEKTISNQNVPLTVLKTILNLAEFMEHDNQGLQLDITSMANLAEKCNAHAKALYYREFEFNFSPDESIESLISLYSNLGQPEAASGMLVFAKNILGTKGKESWLEALGRWDEALQGYSLVETTTKEDRFSNLQDKIRCYDALTQWELVIEQSEEFLKEGVDFSDIALYSARATIQLGKWDKLEKYTERINNRKDDSNYYEAIIAISRKDFKSAKVSIKKSRKYLENFLVGINRQTYHNNYDKLIKLQILSEMEEIIAFKEFLDSVSGEQSLEGASSSVDMIKIVEKKKLELLEMWNDRLEGVEKNMSYWLEIVSVRTLLFKKSEMRPTMLRFAQLAIQKGSLNLCQRIFAELEEELTTMKEAEVLFNMDGSPVQSLAQPIQLLRVASVEARRLDILTKNHSFLLPPDFYLSKFEKMYKLKELNNEQIYECIHDFFSCVEVDHTLKATYCRKLGSWLADSLKEDSQKGFDRVLELYKDSLKYDDSNVKTWHLFGLTNYKRIQQISTDKENLGNLQADQNLMQLIGDAFNGLLKSISLGGPEFTETMQDTLKLLELWFKYGDNPAVQEALRSNYESVDLVCWLNVLPQMITKLDIANDQILANVVHLLEHVGVKYPQGIIFQLMLATQSKADRRRKSALKVIQKIRDHHPIMVTQAELISKELRKVAILQEEEWFEMIDEALKYQMERKYDIVLKIMMDLIRKMPNPPESQNEVFFYQRYGAQIHESECLLVHYTKYKDPMAMVQACEIYVNIVRDIQENMKGVENIHLKNASPKLLTIKDSCVVIPGLYDLKRPQIFISGFHDVLELIPSKRKPRRFKVFGCDGKSYDFLLKSHEDLRQDERVMQSLTLVNTLIRKNDKTEKKNLAIVTYPVIPLSVDTGLLGWVQGCDTLQQLIYDYRQANHIIKDSERVVIGIHYPNYQILCVPHKVEAFRYIMESTKGDDLKKVLWLKSENAEVWLEKRTNYARSLATMSMVGYILGLGDRHLSNLMMQRVSGKIVHIDFGDLFEVTMTRESYPEKVPFRLTRVLTKAMEACGIEGNYRFTCNNVMEVLRENKDSLLAILEAFVTDPLLTWRLITQDIIANNAQLSANKQSLLQMNMADVMLGNELTGNKIGNSMESGGGRIEMELKQNMAENPLFKEAEVLNKKAIEALKRIKAKLLGNDFKNRNNLSVTEQVDYLIRQATSHENICQGWLGWNCFL